jgi:hypothetical protein
MEVIKYNRDFNVGICKDINNKEYYIYKKNYKKPFEYLVRGDKIKGKTIFDRSGHRVLIDIEPLNDKYICEITPDIKFVCC